ncbi:hypothetical protein COY28_02265, partial [Candidatus Woesearchaeota archaeon CG_4_10_14_0_2_um_filter_57_5]
MNKKGFAWGQLGKLLLVAVLVVVILMAATKPVMNFLKNSDDTTNPAYEGIKKTVTGIIPGKDATDSGTGTAGGTESGGGTDTGGTGTSVTVGSSTTMQADGDNYNVKVDKVEGDYVYFTINDGSGTSSSDKMQKGGIGLPNIKPAPFGIRVTDVSSGSATIEKVDVEDWQAARFNPGEIHVIAFDNKVYLMKIDEIHERGYDHYDWSVMSQDNQDT